MGLSCKTRFFGGAVSPVATIAQTSHAPAATKRTEYDARFAVQTDRSTRACSASPNARRYTGRSIQTEAKNVGTSRRVAARTMGQSEYAGGPVHAMDRNCAR